MELSDLHGNPLTNQISGFPKAFVFSKLLLSLLFRCFFPHPFRRPIRGLSNARASDADLDKDLGDFQGFLGFWAPWGGDFDIEGYDAFHFAHPRNGEELKTQKHQMFQICGWISYPNLEPWREFWCSMTFWKLLFFRSVRLVHDSGSWDIDFNQILHATRCYKAPFGFSQLYELYSSLTCMTSKPATLLRPGLMLKHRFKITANSGSVKMCQSVIYFYWR